VKLLYLTTSGELGGAETSLLAMLESLREAEPDWELSVLTPAEGGLVDRLRECRIRARVLPFPAALARTGERASGGAQGPLERGAAAAQSALYASRLSAALRAERAEILHAHGFKMHVLTALARPAGTAVVWHVHGYLTGRPWTARALAAVSSRASAIVANSRSVAADVERVLGTRLPLQTIYNAVDLSRFSPVGASVDLDDAARLPAAPAGTVRVGLVATFSRWKGHHVFLDALASLPAIVPVRGYVIGAPIYQTAGSQFSSEELKDAARARGLSGRVGFTGLLSDMPAVMRALDIVVHASTEPEPFGMVLAEAMASGRALIASAAGGAPELFQDGLEAVGHAPGDVAGLADAIARLAADPVARERLGRAARQRAEQQFDRRRLAASLVPLYRTLSAAA
jgi:glycosyltransferase involved in cell wall biosynthesis